jgi:hypothetical protein
MKTGRSLKKTARVFVDRHKVLILYEVVVTDKARRMEYKRMIF